MMSTIIDEDRTVAMHNPPHPGGIVGREYLEPLGLSVTKAAKGLGVTRQALSDVVNEKAGISLESEPFRIDLIGNGSDCSGCCNPPGRGRKPAWRLNAV